MISPLESAAAPGLDNLVRIARLLRASYMPHQASKSSPIGKVVKCDSTSGQKEGGTVLPLSISLNCITC